MNVVSNTGGLDVVNIALLLLIYISLYFQPSISDKRKGTVEGWHSFSRGQSGY